MAAAVNKIYFFNPQNKSCILTIGRIYSCPESSFYLSRSALGTRMGRIVF